MDFVEQYINGYEQRKFIETLQQIQKMYDDAQRKNSELYDQLGEFNRDDEIQKWQARCTHYRSHSLHNFSDKELELYTDFRAQHYKSCHNGDTFVVTLSGSGIGESIEVACPICVTKQNITDMESW